MGLLFLKTSSVKQFSYENDFSGVLDALHQCFLVYFCIMNYIGTKGEVCRQLKIVFKSPGSLCY